MSVFHQPRAALIAARIAYDARRAAAVSAAIYARSEMGEVTYVVKTPAGRHYGNVYPQPISDVQERERAILRRYLTKAAAESADQKAS